MAPLKRASLVDQLYEQIRDNIITLKYPLGSKLNVNELQDVFGVSSTPLREAVTRLQAEGLVTYENNVGARVITLAPKDIMDIHDLALTLHTAAIRLAMAKGDHQVMADEMAVYVQNYNNSRDSGVRIKNVFDLIGSFYRSCGNTRLDNNMKVIQGQQLLLRHLYFHHLGLDKARTDHFTRIEQAVRRGDTDLVIEILSDNYCRATPILIEALAAMENGSGQDKP
jgi:Transcriptional regulators